jgi:hypothetical protein
MSRILTGFEFNKQYPLTIFVKLTNETEIHNKFEFKTGLNDDTKKFDASDECKAGGIYFCELSKFLMWIKYKRTECIYYRLIDIPYDACVCISNDKYKTNKLILSERKLIWNDERMCEIAIKQSKIMLCCIKQQENEICKITVKQDGHMLEFVKNQTDEICKIAVAQNGRALRHVIKQTEEICIIAVHENGFALEYVKKQTEEICKFAVAQNGFVLAAVINQTDDICEIAVRQTCYALYYVKNKTKEIYEYASKQNKDIKIYKTYTT